MEVRMVKPFARWGRWWWVALAIFLFVTVGTLVSIAWDLSSLSPPQRPPPYYGHTWHKFTVCDSVQLEGPGQIDNWLEAVDVVVDHRWPLRGVVVGPCLGPPAEGECQVRHWTDLVSSHPPDQVDGRTEETVTRSIDNGPVLDCVIYDDTWGTPRCNRWHALLHAMGVAIRGQHAPSGLMAESCDENWRLVDQLRDDLDRI